MRLTLRTLLAYLDDRLPPNNAKEIGQKIANSPFATELVERIRDVKRRRRLASPAKPQPMIDANLVAEYLDDQLTPELVARVEREILASDALLAEVASAHEILGMLRDPVTIEPRLRDRLYLMDPTGQTDVIRAVGGETAAVPESAAAASSQWKPLKSHTASSRRWPIVLGAVLGLIWIIVIATDSRLFGPASTDGKSDADTNQAIAANDDPAKMPDGANAGENNGKAADVVKGTDEPVIAAANGKPEGAAPDAAEVKTTPNAETTATAPTATMPPVANEATVAAADAVDGEKSKSESEMVAADPAEPGNVPEPPMPADAIGANPVPPAVAEVPGDGRPASYYVQSESAVTMVFEEAAKRWISLSKIAGGDTIDMNPNQTDCRSLTGRHWIGIPEAFHSIVRTDSGGWNATVLGPSHIRLRGAPDSGFDVLSGRLRISADSAVAWNDEAKPLFLLGTGNVTARLVLQSQESRAAVEVVPVAAANPMPLDDAASESAKFLPVDAELQVRISVIEGSIAMTLPGQGDQPPVEQIVARNQRMLWTVLQDGTISSVTIDNGEPLAAAPPWLFETTVVEVPELAPLKDKLMEAMGTNADPDECIAPLLSDRNPQIGVLAVRIPAITGDVERLLSILYGEHNELVHRAAIDALSAILQSSRTGKDLIQRSVETRLPMAQVEPAMKLIAGITPAQAADPDVVIDLMKMLEDTSLAARTLAIYRMEQYTKDRMNYFPDNEPSRRREAIRRWQRFLDRNQGKLLP